MTYTDERLVEIGRENAERLRDNIENHLSNEYRKADKYLSKSDLRRAVHITEAQRKTEHWDLQRRDIDNAINDILAVYDETVHGAKRSFNGRKTRARKYLKSYVKSPVNFIMRIPLD